MRGRMAGGAHVIRRGFTPVAAQNVLFQSLAGPMAAVDRAVVEAVWWRGGWTRMWWR